MKSLVAGMGEVGSALYKILSEHYDTSSYDLTGGVLCKTDFLHICIPYSGRFVETVKNYEKKSKAKYTIIHSSVPVGTTAKIEGAMHSPVRGKHPDIYGGLKEYTKYLSFEPPYYYKAVEVAKHLTGAGLKVKTLPETKTTELMKLLGLCRYGVYIAFAKEQEKICKRYGVSYDMVVSDYERTRNDGIKKFPELKDLQQPVLYPFKDYVGGHCTVEDMELLLEQVETAHSVETPLLRVAYDIDRGTKVWGNTNIYPSAKIGKGCSIGQFCEIGENVRIGNNVRIGAFTFIPEGVTIEDNVFIAPKVTFSNDKHPPSEKEKWGKILVKKDAVIGMGSIILPGVTVGEKAVIGAGSIITKPVPDGEIWYGQAAYSHGEA